MQTAWPPSPIFDPTPQPQTWTPPHFGFDGAPPPRGFGDAVAPPWYSPAQQYGSPFGDGSANTMQGLVGGIMSLLQSLLGMLGNLFSANAVGRGPEQHVLDATLSSTGDPHLAETGTTTAGTVNAHFDSMVAHEDLVHSYDVPGGYRVSTTVGAPNANGVTTNASATVHANFGQDRVTMRADGTASITDHGQAVDVASGQTVTLSGGETVTRNTDGSLAVAASNGRGGTIATTLRANGTEVDVTTQAHAIGVGGDIVQGAAAGGRRAAL